VSDESKSCSAPFDAEPTATRSTVPIWIVVLTLMLLFLGVVHFDHHSGCFDANVYHTLRVHRGTGNVPAEIRRGRGTGARESGL